MKQETAVPVPRWFKLTGPGSPRAAAAARAVLVAEVLAVSVMWGPLPLAWMWIASQAYTLTDSIAVFLAITFLGFAGTMPLALQTLARMDGLWVSLRRRAGHKQADGAITRVVTVTFTIGLVTFTLWYYLGGAFVIPFMPLGG